MAASPRSWFVKQKGMSTGFRWAFDYPHTYHLHSEEMLEKPMHPLKLLLKDKLDRADRSVLWTYLYQRAKVGKLATIRKHHCRRLKRALHKALNEEGVDDKGRALEPAGQQNTEASLVGTLHLHPSPNLATCTFDALVAASRAMIRQAMAEQAKFRGTLAYRRVNNNAKANISLRPINDKEIDGSNVAKLNVTAKLKDVAKLNNAAKPSNTAKLANAAKLDDAAKLNDGLKMNRRSKATFKIE